MITEIVERAKNIIFSMEGGYESVNTNDNGTLSIGCLQWHGDRAKELLQAIVKVDVQKAAEILGMSFVREIQSNVSWIARVINTFEKNALNKLLNSSNGRNTQNEFANRDIQTYINHIMGMNFTNEEIIIFLADIENQGGIGASSRIGNTALKTFGKNVTLEDVLNVACNDVIFSQYKARRHVVYNALTTSVLLEVDGIMGKLTITALQKFLKVNQNGIMDKNTIKALQIFLNL